MRRLASLVAYAAVFAAIGPICGAAIFLAYMSLSSPGSTSLSDLWSPGMSLVYVFLIFGAYLLGSIPAAITGLAFGFVAAGKNMRALQRALLGAALGATACILFQLVLRAVQNYGGTLDWVQPTTGAVSGALCGLACGPWVSPNNSSKPTPLRGAA
ncbi:hypothetical protein ACVWZN_001606 [Lysobacter sp. HA35]